MAAVNDLDIISIKDKQYVTVQTAARFIGISEPSLRYHIKAKHFRTDRIESRLLIEWEGLQAYMDYIARRAQNK